MNIASTTVSAIAHTNHTSVVRSRSNSTSSQHCEQLDRASSVENAVQVRALLDPATPATKTGRPNSIMGLPDSLRSQVLERLARRLVQMSTADIDHLRPLLQQAIEQLPDDLRENASEAFRRTDPQVRARLQAIQAQMAVLQTARQVEEGGGQFDRRVGETWFDFLRNVS